MIPKPISRATPNLFPGKELKTKTFIRRLTYPDAELNVNNENVKQAIGRGLT